MRGPRKAWRKGFWRKGLLAATASLASAFAQAAQNPLSAIEAEANAGKPAGTPHVVILDPEAIFADAQKNKKDLKEAVEDWVLAKTGVELSLRKRSLLTEALENKEPRSLSPLRKNPGLSPTEAEKENCYVVPAAPDFTVQSYFRQLMTIDEIDLLGARELSTPPPDALMRDNIIWHEVWHCLDTTYIPAIEKSSGMAREVIHHKAEVFAELASLLESFKKDAPRSFTRWAADARDLREQHAAPLLAQPRANNDDRIYYSFYYHLGPSMRALEEKIEGLGADKVRQMSRAQWRDLVLEVTEKTALDEPAAAALLKRYQDAPPPADAALAQKILKRK